jgi:formylglycine-generating enzyme required for sulfatase activity
LAQSKPPITGTAHTLPFDKLLPRDFERLCLWLVQREGFERAEHLGAAGSEQGRDIVGWRGGELWAFQCKRVQRFGTKGAEAELDKVLGLPEDLRPVGLVFLIACDVSEETRRRARARCPGEIACEFWALTDLDERVKRHPDIVEEFFKAEQRKEAVDMRGAQGPVYKPSGLVEQHFGTQINVPGPGAQVAVTVRGESLLDTGLPSPEAIARHRAALRERLEAEACARWGGMAIYIQEQGATLPIEASPYQTGRLGRAKNLLHLLHIADRLPAGRLLVLGESGSGKTVSLERLAWDLCDGPEPVVPVLVPLFHYDGAPLAEWVRATLQKTGHLELDDHQALLAFLKQDGLTRCFFLFDGLNEVPPAFRDQLTGELVRWISAHPRHPVVLTSRPQDELWRRLRGDVGQAVVVQPIADKDARDYLVTHLGERGDRLYRRLDDRLRAMARTPLILWLIKEAGAAGESVPGNRGELYARFVSRMLRRDTDRRMDADIREPVKRRGLAGLAYHLGLAQRLSCPRDEAVEVVAWEVGEGLADEVVGACARHGLLAGDDPVWFAPHQTVQEHFAALALQGVAKREWGLSGWARLRRTARRVLSGKEEGLAALAADDWWMEIFVQLAGLVDDADRMALGVARVNPWLAWWCVEEGREVSEETRRAVEDLSVRLLESERVADRRRAVGTLVQVRSERVIQPLLRAAADPDAEVVGLAVQALVEMGDAVRGKGLALAQQPDHPLHRSGLAYLEALLGQSVVWVPPGPFLMGSDECRDPSAYDDEFSQHEVTLPGYWIGRYPVMVAQFRAFVEASGYEPTNRDSLEGPGDHPVVRVTWDDALAFCGWLSERSGALVTLPSEAEWEKGARGTDGRIYPWGDEWDPDRCNSKEGGKGHTTRVGAYPDGASPYGLLDMAGNVWEWTRSLARDYPYNPADGREDLDARGLRAVHGGSWFNSQWYARCAFRGSDIPDVYYDLNLGFRVCIVVGQDQIV